MRLIFAVICLVAMSFCQDKDTERLKELKTLPKDVKQVILVQDHKLSLWNRKDCKEGKECCGWEKAFEAPCYYGRNGLNADRHDGDGTTPIATGSMQTGTMETEPPLSGCLKCCIHLGMLRILAQR